MTDVNVREILEGLNVCRIAREMDVPISTIHSWKQANSIATDGAIQRMKRDASGLRKAMYDMKVKAFLAAAKRIRRETERQKKAKGKRPTRDRPVTRRPA